MVEDRRDPLFLGRCRVRIFAYHDADKSTLPTEDLPWATSMQSITSAAMSGIGHAPVGPVEGTWVIGFFADGADNQEPIMMGTMAGIPQSKHFNGLSPEDGFRDSTKKYPIVELMDEPDTNRLARGVGDPFVTTKDAGRSTAIPLARSVKVWDEPKSSFASEYPFAHVFQSESGHVQEFDDTPDAERLQTFHKAGTFVEVDPNGSRVVRIVGNDYEIIERDGNMYVKGKLNITVDGSSNIYVKNNCNLQVDGIMSADIHNDYLLNVAGNMKMTVGGSVEMKAGKNVTVQGLSLDAKSNTAIHVESGTTSFFKSGTGFYIEAGTTFAIKAITAAVSGIFQQMNLTVSATARTTATALKSIVGVYSGPTVVAPVTKKTPTEPQFEEFGFVLTTEHKKIFKIELENAAKAMNDVKAPLFDRKIAKEYHDLKQEELASGKLFSAPAPTADQEKIKNTPITELQKDTPKDYLCSVGLKVVEAAQKDIGVLETGSPPGRNYGGKRGGGELPAGVAGRIDEMVALCGLDNQAKVRSSGEGYYWCAAAVTAWWKAAGLPTPSGSASCGSWYTWAKQKGYFSTTPKVGAVILYGNHVGIVSTVKADGTFTTIEGNTGGGGFRNGVGVFAKSKVRSHIGFVLPPPCA